MCPARSSSSRIRPPRKGMLVAVAPHVLGLVKYPGLVDTLDIRPPHRACHPSHRLAAIQNSHIVSVEGCQTTIVPSVPAAGWAPAGIGTRSQAAWSSGL